MQLFPAIDLRGGKVVRLTQGDYNRMTVYGEDPCAQARQFVEAGARYLHVVWMGWKPPEGSGVWKRKQGERFRSWL